MSPRAWLETSVRGNRKSGGTHISVTAGTLSYEYQILSPETFHKDGHVAQLLRSTLTCSPCFASDYSAKSAKRKVHAKPETM